MTRRLLQAGFRLTGIVREHLDEEILDKLAIAYLGTSDRNERTRIAGILAQAGWYQRCPYDPVPVEDIRRKGLRRVYGFRKTGIRIARIYRR